jgi:ribosomal protein S18 acetylase RimI-like enzyme
LTDARSPGHRRRPRGALARPQAGGRRKALGGDPAELEVWPHNEAAIGLYERTGFEREGLRRDHYRRADGELHSSLIMARLFPEAY